MLTINKFNELATVQNSKSPCVSIYIPTYRAGKGVEDRLRFKNALADAAQELVDSEKGVTEKDAIKYLAPAFGLLNDDSFWSHLSDGLAVFIGEDHFSFFVTPVDFAQFVHVHDHYYLRHLIPLISKESRFFVLALSQNEVRFFEGHRSSIVPVVIDDLIPDGMKEIVASENKPMNLQSHGGKSSGAIYHGHGGGKDDKDENLKKYFRQIDDGLMQMLHDENAPLIIYSVDAQIPVYKDVSNYSNIYNQSISGNPENDDPVLIHEKAWATIEDHFSKEKEETKQRFNQNLADGKASFYLPDIVIAAINGKVDALFVDKNSGAEWGIFDKNSNAITIHKKRQKDSICLLNKAAITTFQSGGTVYNVPRMEFPQVVAPLNAIFRY